jgi:cob(I)alamin adenosyltransferase
MTIYTRKGDKGKTGLYCLGDLVSKSSLKVEVLGVIDEINSFLGMATAFLEDKNSFLKEVQKNLFTIGSILAGAKLNFTKNKTKKLEREIDKIEKTLPKLRHFLLPNGSKEGSLLFIARAKVREGERLVVKLNGEEKINPAILSYLNRLSSYLFVLARKVNLDAGIKEEIWTKNS